MDYEYVSLRPSTRVVRSGLTSTSSPSSPQVMNAFYRRLFPYRPFFLWLNQDHGMFTSFPKDHPPDCPHHSPRQAVHAPRIRVHASRRCVYPIQFLPYRRRFQEGGSPAQSGEVRDWASVLCSGRSVSYTDQDDADMMDIAARSEDIGCWSPPAAEERVGIRYRHDGLR